MCCCVLHVTLRVTGIRILSREVISENFPPRNKFCVSRLVARPRNTYARLSIITYQVVNNYIATFDALLRRHLEWQERNSRVYDPATTRRWWCASGKYSKYYEEDLDAATKQRYDEKLDMLPGSVDDPYINSLLVFSFHSSEGQCTFGSVHFLW